MHLGSIENEEYKLKMVAGFLLWALVACGSGSGDTRVEYYVDSTSGPGDARGADGKKADTDESGQKTADGTGSDGGKTSGLTFVSPSPSSEAEVGDSVSVVVAFGSMPEGTTWSLYFATAAQASTGTAIAENLAVQTTSVAWDTASLAPGVYSLYATLTRDGQTSRHSATGNVTLTPDDPTNAKPQLQLTTPNGEEVLVAGTPAAVSFAGQDADGDALTYKVEYSPDGGATWTSLAANLTMPSYTWNVTGLAPGINYRVRVSATDDKGATASAVSAKSFGVATQPVTFVASFGAMLQQRCGTCHAANRPNAAQFRSDNYALNDIGVNDMAANIKTTIEDGSMPPSGPLGAADKALLTMWVWGGSP